MGSEHCVGQPSCSWGEESVAGRVCALWARDVRMGCVDTGWNWVAHWGGKGCEPEAGIAEMVPAKLHLGGSSVNSGWG